jgi:predicted metal-dependent peptidase
MTDKPKIDVVKRWHTIRLKLCWDCDILAPALAALRIIASDRTPNGGALRTAAVDYCGRVFVNPTWGATLPEVEVRFTLMHEALHVLLRHYERTGGRDLKRWGGAADLVINDAIIDMRLPQVVPPPYALIRGKLTPDMPANLSAEDIYERLRGTDLPTDPDEVGAGCGVITEGPIDNDLSPVEWRNITQTVMAAARGAGVGGSGILGLLSIPPSRVRWSALLREQAAHAIGQAGSDTTTWARRSRRSPIGSILPGTRRNTVQLAIVIDSSGSMSDTEVATCIAEAAAVVDASGVEALLVVHDHVVQAQAWIKPGSGAKAVQQHVRGRGGTVFDPAYDAVAAETKVTFAVLIHFTDGYPCGTWPALPRNCRRGVVALTPDGRESLIPSGWRTIPIVIPGRE